MEALSRQQATPRAQGGQEQSRRIKDCLTGQIAPLDATSISDISPSHAVCHQTLPALFSSVILLTHNLCSQDIIAPAQPLVSRDSRWKVVIQESASKGRKMSANIDECPENQ